MVHVVRRHGALGVHLWNHRGACPDGPHEQTFCPRQRRIWVLASAIVASSMGFMDRIVVSIAMPGLRADLGASLSDAQWISNAYLLLMVALMMFSAAAGERFGLRRVFAIGVLTFTLAALAGALAPATAWLIGARALQGVGAALMVPGSLALVASAYPKAERGKAIGIWAAVSSLMLVIGPLIGGAVISATGDWGWRLLFAINVLLGAAALLMVWLPVTDDETGEHRHFDLVGGVLVSAALLLLTLGLIGDAGMQSVPAVWRLAMFVGAGAAFLAAFVLWEARAREPMMPVTLFANRQFSGANAVTFCTDFAVSANLFFLPMAAIAGWGTPAAAVSVLFLPLPIMLTVLSEPAGLLADRLGPGPLVTLGCVLLAASCAGLAIGFASHDLWLMALPMMGLMAIGQGLVVSPLSTAVMTAEDDADIIVASGVNNCISRAAWLIAVAAMGGVAALVFAMAVGGTPAEAMGLSFGLPPAGVLAPDIEAIRVAATDMAFAAIAWTTAALAVLAAAIAAFTLPWSLGSPAPATG